MHISRSLPLKDVFSFPCFGHRIVNSSIRLGGGVLKYGLRGCGGKKRKVSEKEILVAVAAKLVSGALLLYLSTLGSGVGKNIHVVLEGTLDWDTKIIRLFLRQLAQLGVDVVQVQQRDLLIKNLGQYVDANLLLAGLAEFDVSFAKRLILGLEQHDLSKDLVGEGTRHDEGGVAGGAAEVDKTAFSEKDNVAVVLHQVAVDLGLDVLDGLSIGFQPGNIDFNVEMTDVAHDGVVLHDVKMFARENVPAAGGRDEDLAYWGRLFHGGDLEA